MTIFCRQSEPPPPFPAEPYAALLYLDNEHDQILAALASMRRDLTAFTPAFVANLEAMLCAHFEHEEDLMRRSGFPNLDRHQQAHAFAMDQIARSIDMAVVNGDKAAAKACLKFLIRWAQGHIDSEDGEYIAHVRRLGRTAPG